MYMQKEPTVRKWPKTEILTEEWRKNQFEDVKIVEIFNFNLLQERQGLTK